MIGMGLAARKTVYEEQYDAITVPVEGALRAPYGRADIFPRTEIMLPRWRTTLGERLDALSFRARRCLACMLAIGILGSVCAASQLWSSYSKSSLEETRTSLRSMEGRLSEVNSITLPLTGVEFTRDPGERD